MFIVHICLYFLWVLLETTSVIISVFGNFLVIYVMSKEKKLRQKSYTILIISIAVSDELSSIFVIPLILIRSIKFWDPLFEINLEFCLLFTSILLILTTITFLQLVCVSLDRLWAICYPISYKKNSTKSAKIVIFLTWILGSIFGMIPLTMSWTGKDCSMHIFHYYFWAVLGLFSTIVVTIMYILMYKAIAKQVSLINSIF